MDLMPSEKKPDKLDRYRQHLLDGKSLTDDQKVMLNRYKSAFAHLCSGYTRQQTVKLMIRSGLQESQAYQVVRDTILLFPGVLESNKEGLRMIHYERLMNLSLKAEYAGDYKAAERLIGQANKLMNLYDQSKSGVDPKIFMVPVPVVFSTDPETLKLQQTDDTDHEEI